MALYVLKQTPSSSEVKERVELHLAYTPRLGLHGLGPRANFTFNFTLLLLLL